MVYKYYDSPEGEDCFKKLWFTTKIAAAAGLTWSTLDVILHSHPQGYVQTVARYGHFTLPFIGIAAAFTTTVCVATSVRKKDDHLNYALGGAAAGSIFGIWRKSTFNGCRMGIVFIIAALVKKSSVEDGWNFFPSNIVRQKGSLRGVRHDYSLTEERPRNWTVE
ncbi:hypothetical protein R5R35_004946 [Gryllus longicercus]|uniref:NADH dehydrogenase [ubiquinone] 1 alpha subcomplex subunit 11 n=1 Tax=Gryllus longicercus TaxID=2509291 RepID=A0AAN9VHD2_9ORTH